MQVHLIFTLTEIPMFSKLWQQNIILWFNLLHHQCTVCWSKKKNEKTLVGFYLFFLSLTSEETDLCAFSTGHLFSCPSPLHPFSTFQENKGQQIAVHFHGRASAFPADPWVEYSPSNLGAFDWVLPSLNWCIQISVPLRKRVRIQKDVSNSHLNSL